MNNAIERDLRLPEEKRVLAKGGGFGVGPGGPRPADMLKGNSSVRERLCLTPWRGFMLPGATVVFTGCPTSLGKKKSRLSNDMFQWVATPHLPFSSTYSIAATGVRLSPVSAPQLCLAVAPIATDRI